MEMFSQYKNQVMDHFSLHGAKGFDEAPDLLKLVYLIDRIDSLVSYGGYRTIVDKWDSHTLLRLTRAMYDVIGTDAAKRLYFDTVKAEASSHQYEEGKMSRQDYTIIMVRLKGEYMSYIKDELKDDVENFLLRLVDKPCAAVKTNTLRAALDTAILSEKKVAL